MFSSRLRGLAPRKLAALSIAIVTSSLGWCAASHAAEPATEPANSRASSHANAHAHAHGAAKLDVGVEATRITFQLETPLDNLVGFERAPRTSAERQRVDAAVAKLRAPDQLFKLDPAAQCRLDKVNLQSTALGLGQPDPKEAADGHADLDASFEFSCTDATKARFVDLGLFDFSRLQRLQAQVATPRQQFKQDMKRPGTRLSLQR